jgi:hypothetical protein
MGANVTARRQLVKRRFSVADAGELFVSTRSLKAEAGGDS